MEPLSAAAFTGVAVFQLVKAWNDNAPSLGELRSASPADDLTRNQLLDADILVGGLSLFTGIAIGVMTKDYKAMILLLTTFGLLSLWSHMVLNAHGADTLRREINNAIK